MPPGGGAGAGTAPRPRVLLAIPVLLGGGTEAHTLSLATALLAAGWEVAVCCYHESDPETVAAFEGAGARVTLLGLQRRRSLIGTALRLRRSFRGHRPVVVHVQYLAPGFTAVLAARAAGVRTVFATVHQPGDDYGPRERRLLRLASRLCTAFFAVSAAVERSWFGSAAVFDPAAPRAARRHWTIYNAVDAAGVAEAGRGVDRGALRRSLGIAADAPVVGYVGRLRREKGLDVLLRALPAVAGALPATRVLVVGDGPEAGALRALSARIGIAGEVVWAGRRPRREVWGLYRAMDVVSVPSRFEGFGLAAAEAQAAGLPVVASAVGGLDEVVRDGETGLLVPPGDPAALAAGLSELLGDASRASRMGAAGRAHVAASFSPERFAASVRAVYAQHTEFAPR